MKHRLWTLHVPGIGRTLLDTTTMELRFPLAPWWCGRCCRGGAA